MRALGVHGGGQGAPRERQAGAAASGLLLERRSYFIKKVIAREVSEERILLEALSLVAFALACE